MKDVLFRAWAHVKWEEDLEYPSRHSHKKEWGVTKIENSDKDNEPYQKPEKEAWGMNRGRHHNQPTEKSKRMLVSTWPNISKLSISK